MIDSVVELCNTSLRLLGANRISSLTEETQEAYSCSLFYENSRDEVLREDKWKAAIVRRELATVAVDDDLYENWAYVYQLPTDPYCLLPVSIVGQENEDWMVEGRHLLTNATEVPVLRYVAPIEDPQDMPPDLSRAIVFRLASDLALPLTGQARPDLEQMYMMQLRKARGSNNSKDNYEYQNPKTWAEARFGS